MTSIWVESLHRSFDEALGMLAGAIRDCTDELWESSMWEVDAPDADHPVCGPDGQLVTERAERRALVQARSTPWCVAWHALECLDYDLTGELAPWAPPPPFAGHPHWLFTALPAAWSRSDLLGYVDYCRHRVADALAGMTDEHAAAALPPAHRYSGRPHAWVITSLVGHTVEHGAQIRQFITGAGPTGQAGR